MINVAKMKELELQCELRGMHASTLMENAGRGMAKELIKQFGRVTYLFVCGQGNNGGDGFVAAKHLRRENIPAFVLFCGDAQKLSIPARKYYDDLLRSLFVEKIIDCQVIVDCLLGTGIRGRLREPVRGMIESINATHKIIVSCDVPSGMDPDTGDVCDIVVQASYVLSMHDTKQGIDTHKYRTTVIDIGITP